MTIKYEQYNEFVNAMTINTATRHALKSFWDILDSYVLFEKIQSNPDRFTNLYCMQQISKPPNFPFSIRSLKNVCAEMVPYDDRKMKLDDFCYSLINMKNRKFMIPLKYQSGMTDEFDYVHPLSVLFENSLFLATRIQHLRGNHYKDTDVPVVLLDGGEFVCELPHNLIISILWDSYTRNPNGGYVHNLRIYRENSTNEKVFKPTEFPIDRIYTLARAISMIDQPDKIYIESNPV